MKINGSDGECALVSPGLPERFWFWLFGIDEWLDQGMISPRGRHCGEGGHFIDFCEVRLTK